MSAEDKARLKEANKKRAHEREELYRPLRVAILKNLPREGSKVGYHPIAATVKQLANTLNEGIPREGWVASSQLGPVLVGLAEKGLAVPIAVYRGRGWQITKAGEQWLDQQTEQEEQV